MRKPASLVQASLIRTCNRRINTSGTACTGKYNLQDRAVWNYDEFLKCFKISKIIRGNVFLSAVDPETTGWISTKCSMHIDYDHTLCKIDLGKP